MSAALLDELFRPLKKVEPLLSRREEGWVRGWSRSRWASRWTGTSLGWARSAEWFRTAEDIMSLKERSCCAMGAVRSGGASVCGRGSSRIGAGTGCWGLLASLSLTDLVRPRSAKGLGLGFLDVVGVASRSVEDASDRSDFEGSDGEGFCTARSA